MSIRNTWTGIGNLGQDPVTRETGSGKKVCTFMIACDDFYRHGDETKSMTDWIPVVCWDRTAESCATSLRKGSRVMVSGPLRNRSYKDEADRFITRYEVNAREVVFMDRRSTETSVVESALTEMP